MNLFILATFWQLPFGTQLALLMLIGMVVALTATLIWETIARQLEHRRTMRRINQGFEAIRADRQKRKELSRYLDHYDQ